MKKLGLSVLLLQMIPFVYAADPQTSANFKVQATIENGCSLSNIEQVLDFGRHPVTSQDRVNGQVINTAQSWNLHCTQHLPVKVMLNGGDNFSANIRRMKHNSLNEFVSYRLYQKNDLKDEYISGNTYSMTPATDSNPILNFSVYGVADLNNNNQPRSAGLYKDTVAITITW
ncbi:Csu type fimbrial protein [Acinetobacter colistiniresistens]|uniref:Spore coat protein U/FanG domain-containing protein n=1 Tax=Acinetobacter colistiniresistens TaxID=280145 RepID=S3TMC0_9GAMM|nr:spore coat U domain-containing protein [Acinetobacter colistiniresistens]EPG40839.1 hypothetical protein F907_00670 [Acinetobacter colistiniresistens]